MASRPMPPIRTSTFRKTAARRLAPALTLFCATNVLIAAVGMPSASATTKSSATKGVSLGDAANFAILAGTTVTNTGPTTIKGDLGLSSGTSVTALRPHQVQKNIHAADEVAMEAKGDLAAAYDDVASRQTTDTVGVELGGTTKTPGVYDSLAGYFEITETLTLDAKGDPDAVFIFQAASTLVTASSSKVKLVNGAKSANVFWKVGSSATLGTHSLIRGNVLAMTSITITTGVKVDGRTLARNAAVTLDSATISVPAASVQEPVETTKLTTSKKAKKSSTSVKKSTRP